MDGQGFFLSLVGGEWGAQIDFATSKIWITPTNKKIIIEIHNRGGEVRQYLCPPST